jgi:hypothetical protein
MNPINSVPVRKIYLEDAISRHKYGVSPIKQKQITARNFAYVENLYNFSVFFSAISAFYAINKRYTGRNVYYYAFGGSIVAYFSLLTCRNNLKIETMKILEADEKNFYDYLNFYRYAVIDQVHSYEENKL